MGVDSAALKGCRGSEQVSSGENGTGRGTTYFDLSNTRESASTAARGAIFPGEATPASSSASPLLHRHRAFRLASRRRPRPRPCVASHRPSVTLTTPSTSSPHPRHLHLPSSTLRHTTRPLVACFQPAAPRIPLVSTTPSPALQPYLEARPAATAKHPCWVRWRRAGWCSPAHSGRICTGVAAVSALSRQASPAHHCHARLLSRHAVEFEDRRDAEDAVKALDNGRQGWKVEFARSAGPRTGGPGGGFRSEVGA